MDEKTKIGIERGSGNVFSDIGRPDAEGHYVKAQLVFRMQQIMKAEKLSQSRAADIMGIKQPDVSNLVRGRFRGYSIERILGFLQSLDQDIEIIVRPKSEKRRAARITVRAA